MRADLGSSSIIKYILRRVHPFNRRRLYDAYIKRGRCLNSSEDISYGDIDSDDVDGVLCKFTARQKSLESNVRKERETSD